MKYVLLIAAALVLIAAGCAVLVSRAEQLPQGEVYEGAAQGYRGTLSVQVRIVDGAITEIVVVDSVEDRFVGEAAMEELIDAVIENNSTSVDVVSGATVTSEGFLSAVNNAIMKHE